VIETEWLACADPGPMLKFLQDSISDRKRRLFAAACCRRFAHRLGPAAEGLQVAERFADGEADAQARKAVRGALLAPRGLVQDRHAAARQAVSEALTRKASEAARFGSALAAYLVGSGGKYADERAAQADLLRDLAGNPFHPRAADPLRQLAGVPVQIAGVIYQERRFADLPVLADALEEAGCTDAAILEHCRGPGPHVRGCWVVDALLGRT
jgi:hypothetical protein